MYMVSADIFQFDYARQSYPISLLDKTFGPSKNTLLGVLLKLSHNQIDVGVVIIRCTIFKLS